MLSTTETPTCAPSPATNSWLWFDSSTPSATGSGRDTRISTPGCTTPQVGRGFFVLDLYKNWFNYRISWNLLALSSSARLVLRPLANKHVLGYLTLAVLILHLFGWGKLWNIMKFMNCNLRNFQLRECAAAADRLCWADGEVGLPHGDGAGGGGRQE